MRILLLISLNIIVLTQKCNFESTMYYQGACVPKTCLASRLSRLTFTVIDQNSTLGNLTQSIAYEIQTEIGGDGNQQYGVILRYNDYENNQLVFEPASCLDYRVYQTVNDYEINPIRKNSVEDGDIPTWPISEYEYNPFLSLAFIRFTLTFQDLDDQACQKYNEDSMITWDCYFELAFVLRRITQVSYYFSIRVQVDLDINPSVPQSVDFVQMSQVQNCDGLDYCQVHLTVDSDLLFCKDESCLNTSMNPYGQLAVNNNFFMIHRVNDKSFTGWYISNTKFTFQTYDFLLKFEENEGLFVLKDRKPGYNIYLLQVPIVAQSVTLTAQGVLSQSIGRILQQQGMVSQLVNAQTKITTELRNPIEYNTQATSGYIIALQFLGIILILF